MLFLSGRHKRQRKKNEATETTTPMGIHYA